MLISRSWLGASELNLNNSRRSDSNEPAALALLMIFAIICRRSRLSAGIAPASPLFPPLLVSVPPAPCGSRSQISKPSGAARSASRKEALIGARAKRDSCGLRFRACIFFPGLRHAKVTFWSVCHLRSYI